ncbi:Mucin-5AC [Manis javanica]|nr:Mucin-5AC [Manis javanica]
MRTTGEDRHPPRGRRDLHSGHSPGKAWLPRRAGSGPRLSLPVAFGSAAPGASIRCRCFRRAAGTIS